MSFLDRKIQEIESRIKLAQQANQQFKHVSKVLSPYIEFMQNELLSLTKDLETVRYDLNLLRGWYPIKEGEYLSDERGRHLLTNILRGLVDIEGEFFFQIDILMPLIKDWIYQRNDQNIEIFHKLLSKYVSGLTTLIKLKVPMLSVFRDNYLCHSCFVGWKKVKGHVVCAPFSEVSTLRRWTILAHEVGHAFFDVHAKQFENKVFPKVRSKIFALSRGIKEEIPRAAQIWLESWIPELAADCVATKSLGPAFVSPFISDALHWNPKHVDLQQPTHPPVDARVRFQLKVLELLDLEDFNVQKLIQVWNSYARNVIYEIDPFVENLLLSPEVVDTASEEILELVKIAPIKDIWSSILDAQDMLQAEEWREISVVSLVSALTLLPPAFDLSWILERLKGEVS